MTHYVEVYMQFLSCFQVWLKQNVFDIKDFICNDNLIYPTFFRWLLQFLSLATTKIQEHHALNKIIHFYLCFQTFLGILAITSLRYSVCQLPGKAGNSLFLLKFAQKIVICLNIQKTNVGIRINILEIFCV